MSSSGEQGKSLSWMIGVLMLAIAAVGWGHRMKTWLTPGESLGAAVTQSRYTPRMRQSTIAISRDRRR